MTRHIDFARGVWRTCPQAEWLEWFTRHGLNYQNMPVEHDAFAAQSRKQRRDGGARNAGQRAQNQFRHRHQRAGIACRYTGIRHMRFHRLE